MGLTLRTPPSSASLASQAEDLWWVLSGQLPLTPGHTAGQGRTGQRPGHLRSQVCPPGALRGGGQAQPPGGSGPPRLEAHPVSPSLSWHRQLSPAPPTPFSNAGPWGRAQDTHVHTYFHAACVYLRSSACSEYTPATCRGRGLYTMGLAHEVHVCTCVCLPRHKHGACHTEMLMHVALPRAALSVGARAHAWVCACADTACWHTHCGALMYRHVLCITFHIGIRRHTCTCTLILV